MHENPCASSHSSFSVQEVKRPSLLTDGPGCGSQSSPEQSLLSQPVPAKPTAPSTRSPAQKRLMTENPRAFLTFWVTRVPSYKVFAPKVDDARSFPASSGLCDRRAQRVQFAPRRRL